MIGITHRFLINSIRLIFAFILFLGITGPGTLMAVQLACEPDCPKHQMRVVPSSCCEDVEAAHQELDPCHGIPDEQQTVPSACCGGKLCFDSRIEIQETAVLSNNSADTMAAASKLPLLTSVTSTFPIKPLSLHLFHPIPPTPIYIRTCVFLI